jgi:hypothetical protein
LAYKLALTRGFSFEIDDCALHPPFEATTDWDYGEYESFLNQQTAIPKGWEYKRINNLRPIDFLPVYVRYCLRIPEEPDTTQPLVEDSERSDGLQKYWQGTIYLPYSLKRDWGRTQTFVELLKYRLYYPQTRIRDMGAFMLSVEAKRYEVTTTHRSPVRTISGRLLSTAVEAEWDTQWYQKFTPPRYQPQGSLDLYKPGRGIRPPDLDFT